ncbi:unnamed protein product [Amoebophrya sp. A25]|nr:unnamed protein product [Amoebophrya sp. A25]|eukprot:GSA25T00006052001.1
MSATQDNILSVQPDTTTKQQKDFATLPYQDIKTTSERYKNIRQKAAVVQVALRDKIAEGCPPPARSATANLYITGEHGQWLAFGEEYTLTLLHRAKNGTSSAASAEQPSAAAHAMAFPHGKFL